MPPNSNHLMSNKPISQNPAEMGTQKRKILWKKVAFFIYVHLGGVMGLYYLLTEASWKTWIWLYFLYLFSFVGIVAGTHRLWSHRSYKAKLPLRILLAFLQTLSLQSSIYNWCRDHRLHHKRSDTEFDPHNASKGFFYCHMGWLMLEKDDKVKSAAATIDMSDLEADPVVTFQRKYYWRLAPAVALILPVIVPWYFWNERFQVAWYVCNMLRHCLTLNGTCLVNSVAHMFGNKPYDKNIPPTQNLLVTYVTNGEGFHNYHHAFPWDYKAAELGSYYGNINTAFIDFMAKIGWAYDLKSVSLDMIRKKAERTGDGSWRKNSTWGWGDKDMDGDDLKMAEITHKI